jgi:hypothetical protein
VQQGEPSPKDGDRTTCPADLLQGFALLLDKENNTPLYPQLKNHIVYLIGSGQLQP